MSIPSRIAIFSISDRLGGAEQVLFKIAKYYSEQKGSIISVYFFKSQTTEYWKENLPLNVRIVYLNNNIKDLFVDLRGEKFEFVFSSHLMVNSLLGILRTIKILKTKNLVARESTQVFGRYSGLKLMKYRMAYFLGYRSIDLLICQTERMLGILDKHISYLFKRTNVKVIPNPFDFPDKQYINEEVILNGGTIVSAGRLIREKGFDILISAFAEIIKEIPSLNLMILGEGSERKKLEKLINELDIKDKVILKGHVKNVYPYFKLANVCVVSSIREGFPNVLLQMMSQNDKVVSTDCAGGILEIQGVFVVAPDNVKELVGGIKKALNYSSENRALFDKELQNRSIDSFIQKIESLLIK